jgi:hypothetical protein
MDGGISSGEVPGACLKCVPERLVQRKETMKCSSLVFGVLLVLSATAASLFADTVYTDDFNRGDAATLGSNWSTFSGESSLAIASNVAANTLSSDSGNVFAAATSGQSKVVASVDFQACNTSNAGCPNTILGINYNGGARYDAGSFLYVQGTVACKFWVDGSWRDTDSAAALTAGNWYRLTLAQNGSVFEGTLATQDGATVLKDFTYTSSLQTVSTGKAFFESANFPDGVTAGSPALDNFSLTIVPEPGTMTLCGIGIIGLLAYAWRKKS